MARSARTDRRQHHLTAKLLDANPMTDVTKGPFYDVAIVPPANEIASAEAEADRVSTLYSRFADRPGALADGEIAAIGRAFKVATPVGRKAKVLLTFYLTSLPTTSIDIPAGVAVGSADGVFVFVTTTSVTRIDASTAATRLDAGSGRYLFNVEAEAVAVGGAYNLPAYRITKLLTPIPGVAGVYNAVASSGGSSPDRSSSTWPACRTLSCRGTRLRSQAWLSTSPAAESPRTSASSTARSGMRSRALFEAAPSTCT